MLEAATTIIFPRPHIPNQERLDIILKLDKLKDFSVNPSPWHFHQLANDLIRHIHGIPGGPLEPALSLGHKDQRQKHGTAVFYKSFV